MTAKASLVRVPSTFSRGKRGHSFADGSGPSVELRPLACRRSELIRSKRSPLAASVSSDIARYRALNEQTAKNPGGRAMRRNLCFADHLLPGVLSVWLRLPQRSRRLLPLLEERAAARLAGFLSFLLVLLCYAGSCFPRPDVAPFFCFPFGTFLFLFPFISSISCAVT